MTEKIKTALCAAALLLALLAAYVQEASFRQGTASGTAFQPGPFTAVQIQ